MARMDGRSQFARWLSPKRLAVNAPRIERLDRMVADTGRFGRIQTWMRLLVDRRPLISSNAAIRNATEESVSGPVSDQARFQRVATGASSVTFHNADAYLIAIRAVLRRFSGLTDQLNRLDVIRAPYAHISTIDYGEREGAQNKKATPTALNDARAHGLTISRSTFPSYQPARQPVSSTKTLERARPVMFRHQSSSAAQSAIQFEKRVTPLFIGTFVVRNRSTSRHWTMADAQFIEKGTNGSGTSRQGVTSNFMRQISYSQATRPQGAKGNAPSVGGIGARRTNALYKRAVQLSSIRFESQESREPSMTSNSGTAGRLRGQQGTVESAAQRGDKSSSGERRGTSATGLAASVVVNFSPSVTITGGARPIDLENSVLQAIARHSHELVRIVAQELRSQHRAGF